MAHYVPTAPEWQAHFHNPDDPDVAIRHSVAFWECRETEAGTTVRGYCPTYGPNGKFVQRGDPNFLGFALSSQW